MFTNYLKIAFRNLIKHKGYSFINIAGLAVGMAVCILIILWVQHEVSFDRFHKNADKIHLVVTSQPLETGLHTLSSQVSTVGPLLKDKIPEVEDYVRIYTPDMVTLTYGEKAFQENPYFVDPSFLSTFSFPVVSGDLTTAMDDPHSVVLTESMAQKYFGEEDPIGKTMIAEGTFDLIVTAVLEDPPDNTEVRFAILIPIEIMNEVGHNLEVPSGADYITVLLLSDGADLIETNGKINFVLSDYFVQMDHYTECPYTFSLNPLTKWHLYSFTGTGNRYQYVYIFAAVALFILLIACMNFINLSTARSVTRAKEIGLRKVIGANRIQLVRHLLGEYLVLSIISAIIAVGIAELLLPVFNDYAGKTLTISYTNVVLIAGLIGTVVITGILAGIFPALYLSAFQPVTVMRGLLKSGKGGMLFRRILVVVQFTLSLILIVGTIVISTQINYLGNKDLGMDKTNVLYVVPTSGVMDHYQSFKQDLLENPNITNVTAAAQWIPHINSTIGQNFQFEGKDPNLKLELHFDWVNLDYAKTFGLEMVDGRFYSEEFPTDLSEGLY